MLRWTDMLCKYFNNLNCLKLTFFFIFKTSKRLVSNSIRYTISKGCTSKQMCDIRYPNRLEEYNCCSKDFCNSSTTLNSSILTISLVFLLLLLF